MENFYNIDWEKITKDYYSAWARDHREAAKINERKYRKKNIQKRREESRKYIISDEKKKLYNETNRLRYHRVIKNK